MATGGRSSEAPAGEPSDRHLLGQFVGRQDERAFAELVRRHGPMVLSVCARVLRDEHEAEDAFQATFLVLACKADTLAEPDLLANWLYGVAYRTASRARARVARRRATEQTAGATPLQEPMGEDPRFELRAALDDELSRLPEKYRQPLVLCYLAGLTNEEAARRLGRPAGSMSALLARGRALLRARLTRLGVTFDLRLCGRLLAQHDLPVAAVPAGLVDSTAKAAVLLAAGRAPDGVSPSTEALTEEVLGSLRARRLRRAAVVLAVLLLVVGLGLLACGLGA